MIARLIIDPMSVLTQLSSIPWWGMVWSTEPTKDIYRCGSLGERIRGICCGFTLSLMSRNTKNGQNGGFGDLSPNPLSVTFCITWVKICAITFKWKKVFSPDWETRMLL